ncbi:MAG: glycerate kinase [Acidimicrobiales bacterium]
MRVVVAPDSFGGTLSALEAAEAMAAGWSRALPETELELVPISDGGPGFIDVMGASLGGERFEVEVRDPLLRPVSAVLLHSGDSVYLETAQSCGLALLTPQERDPLAASSAGVGDLLRAAYELAPERIVAGLGGSATNDGGAGMLQEMGLGLLDASGRPLVPGAKSLAHLDHLDHIDHLDHLDHIDHIDNLDPMEHVDRAAGWLSRPELVVACDVDNPLLGPQGATAVFAAQKGASEADREQLERALALLVEVVGRDLPGSAGVENVGGAGAAGGLGYGMLLLGGQFQSGVDLVLSAVRLRDRLVGTDLVITGEGSFDSQSLRGKAVSGVARVARAAGVPCVVLAGKVSVGEPDFAAAGIAAAWSVVDEAGAAEAALAEPARFLERLAFRVASAGGVAAKGTC